MTAALIETPTVEVEVVYSDGSVEVFDTAKGPWPVKVTVTQVTRFSPAPLAGTRGEGAGAGKATVPSRPASPAGGDR